MKSWPARTLILAGLGSLAVALPAFGQDQEAPESLLPPGFEDPQNLPPPDENRQAAPPSQSPGAAPALVGRLPGITHSG